MIVCAISDINPLRETVAYRDKIQHLDLAWKPVHSLALLDCLHSASAHYITRNPWPHQEVSHLCNFARASQPGIVYSQLLMFKLTFFLSLNPYLDVITPPGPCGWLLCYNDYTNIICLYIYCSYWIVSSLREGTLFLLSKFLFLNS